MKNVSLLLFIVVIIGCNPKASFEDLYLCGNKYCSEKTKSPYTGEITIRFKSGNISNKIEMKHGIPNGTWESYGYKNEIIQRGHYTPFIIDGDNPLSEIELSRLNVCVVKEGAVEFTNVLLVVDTENYPLPIDLKDRIDVFLKSKSIDVRDSINEIRFVKNELE